VVDASTNHYPIHCFHQHLQRSLNSTCLPTQPLIYRFPGDYVIIVGKIFPVVFLFI